MTRLFVLAAASLVATAGACHRPPSTVAMAVAPDTLTGIVSITGTSFEQQLMLRSADVTTRLSTSAADSSALFRLGGVELRVIGTRTSMGFRVDRFTAISVAGSPVADGIVRADGDRLVLETANGRLPLGNPPAALRNLIAARVWIGGPLDTGPNSYGIIAPAR